MDREEATKGGILWPQGWERVEWIECGCCGQHVRKVRASGRWRLFEPTGVERPRAHQCDGPVLFQGSLFGGPA